MTDLLLIEDNMELAAILCEFLARDGYSLFHAQNGEEGILFLKKESVKLVLLDLMLPGIDGFSVCEEIRKQGPVPIMVLSARTDKESKISSLVIGADDYIEKPYDLDVLLAKIKAHIRRSYELQAENVVLTDGELVIDLDATKVTRQGEDIEVTIKEFNLLVLFLQNKDKTLRKEWLFDKVWGMDSESEPSTLTVHINKLREKIEENPQKPQKIITVWGVGYKYEGI